MREFECKISYSLVSLGEEVRLDRPDKIADYLRSAFDENPMQEAFYCVSSTARTTLWAGTSSRSARWTRPWLSRAKSCVAPSSPAHPRWSSRTIIRAGTRHPARPTFA